MKVRNKTVAVWLALLGGPLGLHRFYLKGLGDTLGWLYPLPTALGLWGVERLQALGQDDKLSWVLIPLLGFTVASTCLTAIVYALTDREKWNRQFNPGLEAEAASGGTNWLTIGALVVALLVGTIALMGSLAFGFQRYFEYQVEEARKIAELTKKKKRVTQMGTQIHAEPNYRRVVELIRSGAIGNVLEVHTRVGKAWSGRDLEPYSEGTPENMHWDEWLGPCPTAPYHPVFHPARWRGYWAYGNGTLGDMGCHHLDLVFWALDLRHPTRIAASGPPAHPQFAPEGVKVEYDFPARGSQPAVKVTWYDGNLAGEAFKKAGAQSWGDGSLFIGDKGMLLADYGGYRLLPEDKYKGFVAPAKSIPDSIGHYEEWMQANVKFGFNARQFMGTKFPSLLFGVLRFAFQRERMC